MHIGITERGDAAIDLSWIEKCEKALADGSLDGAVIITKNLSPIIDPILDLHKNGFPLIIHATCTGYGGTDIEPNVPKPSSQLTALNELISRGFPKRQCVLRVDPIIPTSHEIEYAASALRTARQFGILPDIRVRISMADDYRHVKQRYLDAGKHTIYEGNCFGPNCESIARTTELLESYPDVAFEACAEPGLHAANLEHAGCISGKDLEIMGLSYEKQGVNPQNRHGCLCLSCKTELLSKRGRCPHGCLYCYWR